MDGFSPAWVWAVVGLVLVLSELLTGAFVLLALGIAALLTAAAVPLLGVDLTGQLIFMGVASGILVPVAIYKIRPMFSPKGVRYGTTGAGAETGKTYRVEPMSFDPNMLAIKVNGDQYRIKAADDSQEIDDFIRVGDAVTLERFDGTIALVRKRTDQ